MGYLDVENFINQNEINTIEVGFADVNGILRGKSIPARHFLKNIHSGFEFGNGPFVWDVQCGVYDDIEEGNFTKGFRDIVALPVLATLKQLPWKDNTAFLLGEVRNMQRDPLEIDPRQILKKIVERSNTLGYRPIIGAEIQFYLLDEHKKPLYNEKQCYSLYRNGEADNVVQEMIQAIEALDIHIEAFHAEYGASQYEVVTECGDALDIADQLVLIKHAVKEVARKHGLCATFMPKPWSDYEGNGFHIYQSLWDLNKQLNYFEKEKEVTDKYLAGLLTYSRELTLLGAPTINAYKRFQIESFAPVNVTASEDDRTVAVRSILERGSDSRIEYRLGSSDANPYLIIAGCLAAGINGLENKLFIAKNFEGQSYAKKGIEVPLSLADAVDLFVNSYIAKEYLGSSFVNLYAKLKRHEVEAYRKAVTDWEQKRYLEVM